MARGAFIWAKTEGGVPGSAVRRRVSKPRTFNWPWIYAAFLSTSATLVATLGIARKVTKSATIAFSCASRQARTASRGLPARADEIVNPNAQIAAAQGSRVPSLTLIVRARYPEEY